MSGIWSKDELQRIAETDDLHISPFREDGKTYGTPTWIWSVVVDGELYVRSYNGQVGAGIRLRFSKSRVGSLQPAGRGK